MNDHDHDRNSSLRAPPPNPGDAGGGAGRRVLREELRTGGRRHHFGDGTPPDLDRALPGVPLWAWAITGGIVIAVVAIVILV